MAGVLSRVRRLWVCRCGDRLRAPETAAIPAFLWRRRPALSVDPDDGRSCGQYGCQLRDDDNLAGLRRRNDHELLQPDRRPRGAELSGGSRGSCRRHRVHPRHRHGRWRRAGKLLARRRARCSLGLTAAEHSNGVAARLARRTDELQPVHRGHDSARRVASRSAGPGSRLRGH